MILDQATCTVPEWLTALGTIGACVIALVIALFGKRMEHRFYSPNLDLEAVVRRPEAQKVGRWQIVGQVGRPIGDAWFFRLAITNSADAPGRDVQVFLRRVEKMDGTVVDRFSPMNLKWANTDGKTTRKVLLRDVPVYCDFIHILDPASRSIDPGNDLDTVPEGEGVLCLDVEATSTAKAHLLEPGAYRFHLFVAAENFRARSFTVEVRYGGKWFPNQNQMFDEEVGFWMKRV